MNIINLYSYRKDCVFKAGDIVFVENKNKPSYKNEKVDEIRIRPNGIIQNY